MTGESKLWAVEALRLGSSLVIGTFASGLPGAVCREPFRLA